MNIMILLLIKMGNIPVKNALSESISWVGNRVGGRDLLLRRNFDGRFDNHLFDKKILNYVFEDANPSEIASLFNISDKDMLMIMRENTNIPTYRNGYRETSHIDAFSSSAVLTSYIIAMKEREDKYGVFMTTYRVNKTDILGFLYSNESKKQEFNNIIREYSEKANCDNRKHMDEIF